MTNSGVSAEARKQVKEFCTGHGYGCEFWARTKLDWKVKRHQDILNEFFDQAGKSDDHSAHFIAKGDLSININVYGNMTGGSFSVEVEGGRRTQRTLRHAEGRREEPVGPVLDAGGLAEAGRSEQETKGMPVSKTGPLSEQHVSISRLPATSGSELLGREAELKILDEGMELSERIPTLA